jgi:hypothetical protein
MRTIRHQIADRFRGGGVVAAEDIQAEYHQVANQEM